MRDSRARLDSNFPNNGWDPYGLTDTSHHWIDVGDNDTGGIYNLSGSILNIVWGSPNDNANGHENTVTFYSGADGTGSIIGSVSAYDLYNSFTGISNTQDPGYLIKFATSEAFGSVKFERGQAPSSSPSRPASGSVHLDDDGGRLRGRGLPRLPSQASTCGDRALSRRRFSTLKGRAAAAATAALRLPAGNATTRR